MVVHQNTQDIVAHQDIVHQNTQDIAHQNIQDIVAHQHIGPDQETYTNYKRNDKYYSNNSNHTHSIHKSPTQPIQTAVSCNNYHNRPIATFDIQQILTKQSHAQGVKSEQRLYICARNFAEKLNNIKKPHW
eukprot:467545_1